ncbi:MAG TPA: DNA-binding protein [Cyanothece sp. UBA12306]|nr:DNA-binding protein [Cyanothece sp. UBA12306]
MTEEQIELLFKARQSVSVAQMLVENNYPDFAVSRAYYAMFYIAEAFLEGEGLSFSKHSAVISAFGREFVKLGKVPTEYHRKLIKSQELRNTGDYGGLNNVTIEQAKDQIVDAQKFLTLAESLIGLLPPI